MSTKSFKVFLGSDSAFDAHMEATARAFWRARLAEVPEGENKVSALLWATRTPVHRIYRILAALGIRVTANAPREGRAFNEKNTGLQEEDIET